MFIYLKAWIVLSLDIQKYSGSLSKCSKRSWVLIPELGSQREAPEGANYYGSKGYKRWINLFLSEVTAERGGDEIRNSVTALRDRGESSRGEDKGKD